MLSKILKTSWAKHTSRCFTKSHAAFQWPADSDLFEGVNRCSSYQLIHSPFSCPFHWTPEALSFVPGRKRLLSFEETQLQQIFIEKALGLGLLKKKEVSFIIKRICSLSQDSVARAVQDSAIPACTRCHHRMLWNLSGAGWRS